MNLVAVGNNSRVYDNGDGWVVYVPHEEKIYHPHNGDTSTGDGGKAREIMLRATQLIKSPHLPIMKKIDGLIYARWYAFCDDEQGFMAGGRIMEYSPQWLCANGEITPSECEALEAVVQAARETPYVIRWDLKAGNIAREHNRRVFVDPIYVDLSRRNDVSGTL